MAIPTENVFHYGIRNVLQNWTALQLAIENGMGGPESRAKELWLADVIEKYFIDNDDLLPEEVEEYIEDILSYEFNTIADDGSVLEVSKKICQYFQFYRNKQESNILENCQKKSRSALEHSIPSNISGENSMQSVPQIERQIQNLNLNNNQEPNSKIDEDGWTLVTHHRRKNT